MKFFCKLLRVWLFIKKSIIPSIIKEPWVYPECCLAINTIFLYLLFELFGAQSEILKADKDFLFSCQANLYTYIAIPDTVYPIIYFLTLNLPLTFLNPGNNLSPSPQNL